MTVGGIAALALTDWRGEVTRGFLRLSAALISVLAVLAWLIPGGRSTPVAFLLAVVVLGSFAYFLLLLPTDAGRLRWPVALSVSVGGTLLLALLGWTAPNGAGVRALPLAAMLADTLVLGGAGIGLVLGHWYLVTPRLSARPLRRLVDVLLVGLAVEVAVALWPAATGSSAGGPGLMRDVVVWGRLAAAVVLPAVMAVAARACCQEWPRGRALQAATGLLYVATGSALGGVLLGNLLRFGPRVTS